jgi:4-aminobutyrate aminotransferase-like enzyme
VNEVKLDPTMANAFVPGNAQLPDREVKLVERRQRLLGPAYRLFYQRPVEVVRGEGVWLYDSAGNALLDVYNNVASLGHCHPHVVAAMARQAGVLATNTRYLSEPVLDYAERLLTHFPPALSHLMFTCTGSESNDLAIRLSKARTGGTGFIVTEHAYHGTSDAVAALSPSLAPNVNLGEHVRTVPAPGAARLGSKDVGAAFRKVVQGAIEDLLRHGIKPAALIVDSIFSSDGVLPDPAGFLKGAVEAIHDAGGLFICDEVQPGFGRTGSSMWGFQRHGVVPDIVTLGKPMGNGYPVAGIVVRPKIVEEFGRKARYFNTFGGNTVAVAVAAAVLDVIEREGLQQNAATVGAYLIEGVKALAGRFPAVGDVRGAGLFLGVDIVGRNGSADPRAAAEIVNGLRENNVLISATGPNANILKIRPPLVFTRANADFFLEKLDRVLRGLGGKA